jgi:serine/threonine-protein kinase
MASRCARASARGALSVDAALDSPLQVARGLVAAHARGIVHRDLKPENIFLAADGRREDPRFRPGTLHDSAGRRHPRPRFPPRTARPLLAGTAGYMAPEQVRGEVVDGRADIFALGAVLYEMLAGRRRSRRRARSAPWTPS